MKTTKRTLIFTLLYLTLSSCFAQTRYNGDSVIEKMPFNESKPMVSSNGKIIKSNPYTYQYFVEKQFTNCPAGFTGQYGNQYASAERTVTITNDGPTVVSKAYGPWQATDEECAKTETQSLSCPAGYNGSITQTRLITTTGTAENWTTTSDTCAPIPVVCTASNWQNTYACPTGYTGNITSTSYNVCPNGPYQSGTQYEGPRTNNCVAVTPPTTACEWEFGVAIIGTQSNPCHLPGGGGRDYPRNQTYTCKASGWVLTNPGNSFVKVWCD